jgi:hypothetical protein
VVELAPKDNLRFATVSGQKKSGLVVVMTKDAEGNVLEQAARSFNWMRRCASTSSAA